VIGEGDERHAAFFGDAVHVFRRARLLCVRPETDLFTGTNYAFLGNASRLDARFATVMADVIHPANIAVAAQNPPVADGMFQMTTYLHSGEVETHAADLDAGGRAGWDVVIDRNYRSRTFATSPIGFGWDSSMFARLRPLPTGAVEYRDGSGETYTFQPLSRRTSTTPSAARSKAPSTMPKSTTPTRPSWSRRSTTSFRKS